MTLKARLSKLEASASTQDYRPWLRLIWPWLRIIGGSKRNATQSAALIDAGQALEI